MSFADVAHHALEKALETYEKLAVLASTIERVDAAVRDFRDETRKRLADFEQRIDGRASIIEARTDARTDRLEKRLQDLETRQANLSAMANGALAESIRLILRARGDSAISELGEALESKAEADKKLAAGTR